MTKKIIIEIVAFIFIVVFNTTCGNSNIKKEDKLNTENISDTVDSVLYEPEEKKLEIYNSIACMLAGKNTDDSTFSKIINSNKYKNYQINMKYTWDNFYKKHEIIKSWSDTNINNCDTIFYPFGGPDFNYLNSFFPDCRFSVLIGLEKVGRLPFLDSISTINYSEILNAIGKSVQTNLDFSFFRTNSMQKDLASYIEGTLPVFLYFLSSYNYEIINIKSAIITDNGEIEKIPFDNNINENDKYANGIEIIYKMPKEEFYRKLYYFSMDLSDNKINNSSFKKMMEKYFNNKTTFLKAASYLLHIPEFTSIKNMILSHSSQIISDPSGILYKNFDNTWNITLYGDYIGPIQLFSGRIQKDLLEIYKSDTTYPINFRMGYHPTSPSFIVARKKL